MRIAVHFNFAVEIDGARLLSRDSFKRIRQKVKRRDNITCYYCGKQDKNGQVDHIQPLSKGGTDDMGNLVWACQDCNSHKAAMSGIDWLFSEKGQVRSEGLALEPHLYEFLIAVTQGQSCSHRAAGKVGLGRQQFEDLRDTMLESGYVVWNDEGSRKQGVRLTADGVKWVHETIQEVDAE